MRAEVDEQAYDGKSTARGRRGGVHDRDASRKLPARDGLRSLHHNGHSATGMDAEFEREVR